MQKIFARRLFILSLVLVASVQMVAQHAHSSQGTAYLADGVSAYAKSKHGADGALFLDPFFIPTLQTLSGKKLLDAGCGAGPWSIYAAQHGAHVWGVDLQKGMIDRAHEAAQQVGVDDRIEFSIGSVAALSYEDSFFDCAISINVGCNLPLDVFVAHFRELYRVLKPGGSAIITAPASFTTLFTDGTDEEINSTINQLLPNIDGNDAQSVLRQLNTLTHVLRGTFVTHNGRVIHVDDESMLEEGDAIWRKIPGLAVPNFYHSEQAYEDAIKAAGLKLVHVDRAHFTSIAEWEQSGISLGQEYVTQHPFAVFHVSK
jgi:2-polyprenyl-3-methyl-5-hydroxy-6-metoxy-1,4-benzoquinol methylase